jgi:ribonuclease HII
MSPAGWEMEVQYWEMGQLVAGVDEAGRGPLAGPVVAAAVIFPFGCALAGIDDSKKLSPARREEYFSQIEKEALAYSCAVVDTEFIDRRGILPATFLAMTQALEKLVLKPALALIDGNLLPPQLPVPARAIIGGDGECGSIAAASIVAKVTRDRLMGEWHKQFPHYGFDHNKGYGTDFHLQALAQHGPCPLHRRSFSPVRDLQLPF